MHRCFIIIQFFFLLATMQAQQDTESVAKSISNILGIQLQAHELLSYSNADDFLKKAHACVDFYKNQAKLKNIQLDDNNLKSLVRWSIQTKIDRNKCTPMEKLIISRCDPFFSIDAKTADSFAYTIEQKDKALAFSTLRQMGATQKDAAPQSPNDEKLKYLESIVNNQGITPEFKISLIDATLTEYARQEDLEEIKAGLPPEGGFWTEKLAQAKYIGSIYRANQSSQPQLDYTRSNSLNGTDELLRNIERQNAIRTTEGQLNEIIRRLRILENQ